AELAPEIVRAFLAKRGGQDIVSRTRVDGHRRIVATFNDTSVTVDITSAGSSTAFEGLAAETCDIGMSSRAINDGEVDTLRQAGAGDLRSPATEHVLALDGIAVIVHPNNPLRSIDRESLRDVFSGAITSWSQLGGGDQPIAIYARDNHSGTFDTFKHLVLGKLDLVSTARRFESSEGLADAVASDPAGIGFIGLPYVRSARALAIGDRGAKPLLPTSFTVTTESYLLSRRLFLYTRPRHASSLVPELVSFALSPSGQRVVQDARFVDLDVVAGDSSTCTEHCPRRYVELTHGARRLSVDFRFRRGSDDADSRAARDLHRVVHFLERHRNGEVILLGFSDASGDRSGNVRLSRKRADVIASELATRGIRASYVEGFGPAMPLAANETEADREKNRRVEIWVR
nr:substrate-binding domain-containing protein [Deltaproteobacteria bacterium]